MQFLLDDILVDSIVFAMEDQNNFYLVDAATGELKIADEIEEPDEDDVERYYDIPRWDSSDGYEMLEEFTAALHHPFCYSELRQVLSSGRGVFRNFKNVLKSYPEVEKKFYLFKDKTMKGKIFSWYNDLREKWGLEKLSEEQDIEENELVLEDFEFCAFEVEKDLESVLYGENLLAQEKTTDFQGEAGDAVREIYNRECKKEDPSELTGLVCRTVAGEFTGCILAVPMPSKANFTVFLTDFFVLNNYRGLGIGETLLEKCLLKFKDDGKKWVFVPYQIIPQTFVTVLERMGFESTHFGFAAKL